MPKKFQKRIEDFVCEHCGFSIMGSGYTNHCPNCLWSKHVDINPGDRAAECGGLMKPIKTELDHGEQIITHKCIKCGHEKRNRQALDDNMDELIRLINK